MNKSEFLEKLKKALSGLPQKDIEEHLSFYGEMIDDRIEEGQTQQDAVADIGSVKDIAAQIIVDTPLAKIAKERLKPRARLRWWEIFFLILGSPIWLSILISVFAVILSVYVSLCSVIISLWAVFVSLLASGFGLTAASFILFFSGHKISAISSFAAGLVCAGLGIFMFFGCKAATKGIIVLTKKVGFALKNCFIKKEVAQ